MKYNDRELITISCKSEPTIEGRLAHQKPTSKEWSDWVINQSATFKERWFKLKSNLLFYYRLNESDTVDLEQPLGVLVLETAIVQYESTRKVSFGFSITFRDEPDRKHIFACRSEYDCNRWVEALKMSSYEYLRTQLIIIEKKLSMRVGEENLNRNTLANAKHLNWCKKSGTGFTCHVDESCNKLQPHRVAPAKPPVNEVKLIDL